MTRSRSAYADLFPDGLDYAWLAQDSAGRVAVFTNAGDGPIPVSLLKIRDAADRAEKLVKALPRRGSASLLVTLPRPDDYLAFAERGFFAYDWQDRHRTAKHVRGYELLARPHAPALVDELPPELAQLVRCVKLESVQFDTTAAVRVHQCVPAYTPVLPSCSSEPSGRE